MKVLLISANTEQINMPTLPLGLACVAAATRKAGHEVAYLDLMAQEDVRTVIKEVPSFNGVAEAHHFSVIAVTGRSRYGVVRTHNPHGKSP